MGNSEEMWGVNLVGITLDLLFSKIRIIDFYR